MAAYDQKHVPPWPEILRLKKLARDSLVLLLESIPGLKDLVVEPELIRLLDRIADVSVLKANGVRKIFKLEGDGPLVPNAGAGTTKRIYLLRPNILTVKYICDQINQERGQRTDVSTTGREYILAFSPRKLYTCDLILEQEGVFGYVESRTLPLGLLVIDRDLCSLEIPQIFRNVFLEGESSWLHTVAQSLIDVQRCFGTFPNIHTVGRAASTSYEVMLRLIENQSEVPRQNQPEYEHCIIIDRDVDYITPLCSSVTYEALLDETFTINMGRIELGPEVTGKPDQTVKLNVNSQDLVYEEIRNRHFSNIFDFLRTRAQQLQGLQEKGHNLASIQDIKNYIGGDLKTLKQQQKSLALFICAAEVILNRKENLQQQLDTEYKMLCGTGYRECYGFLEELIIRQQPLHSALRLMCLLSLTQDGISTRDMHALHTLFLQSHGYRLLPGLHNLSTLGLFVDGDSQQQQQQPQAGLGRSASVPNRLTKLASSLPRTGTSPYKALNRKLLLVPKESNVELRNPTDMSYVLGGSFTPLSCKLIELILSKSGFTGLDDVLKLLNVPHSSSVKGKSSAPAAVAAPGSSYKNVFLYFIGGVSYTEVAALRFLGKLRGYQFTIATTAMINGSTLIQSVLEPA